MSIRKDVIACAFGLTVAALTITHAQRDLKVSPLTAEDHVQIQQLVARFGHAFDTAANDGYLFADLFAPSVGAFGSTAGREPLATLARNSRKDRPTTRHFVTNVIIRSSAQGASGTQYEVMFEIGRDGKQSTIVHTGRYEDSYVKTARGWRFQKRDFATSTPTSEASKAAVPQPPASGPRAPIIVEPNGPAPTGDTHGHGLIADSTTVASYGNANGQRPGSTATRSSTRRLFHAAAVALAVANKGG